MGVWLRPSAARVTQPVVQIGASLRVRGWLWRRIMPPAVFPFHMTGVITASGGSWNASIVVGIASRVTARSGRTALGLVSPAATEDFQRIVLGIVVMSACVVLNNRAFWRLLYLPAESKFRLV